MSPFYAKIKNHSQHRAAQRKKLRDKKERNDKCHSSLVTRLGLEPKTPSLKGMCSTC